MSKKLLIKFKGHDKLSSSAISHYLQQTDINYAKLMIVQKICTLIKDGVEPDSFVVASKSAELFATKDSTYDDFENFEVLARKEESAQKFWNIINRYHRPVVFYKKDNQHIPIFDYQDENRLIIRKLGVNSPVEVNLEGVGSSMVDLYYGAEREQRNRVQWENEQIGQVAQNINDITRASATVNDPAVPEGVRSYAENILNQLMARQIKLNDEIGISDGTISIIA